MKNRAVLLGSGRLAESLKFFLEAQQIEIVSPEQVPTAGLIAVFDLHTGYGDNKRVHLTEIERKIPAQVPIFTSVLHRTATEIASWLSCPVRVVGFSPLQFAEMTIIEVSRPLQAEEASGWLAQLDIIKRWGKEVEEVGDEPGLVFPRTLALLVNEAAFALAEGIATKESIDLAMRRGTHWPWGPLEWADRIGIDQIIAILAGLYRELGEERYRPAPLLKKMAYAGYVGQASGRGFYCYEN